MLNGNEAKHNQFFFFSPEDSPYHPVLRLSLPIPEGRMMLRTGVLVSCSLVTLTLSFAEEKPKPTISKIMKQAFLSPYNRGSTNNLDNKLLQGRATEAEKKELLELLTTLSQSTPPKGNLDDWKKRTTEFVAATKALIAGEEMAKERFVKARNCKECHLQHRP
jgi:hypothetical protein